MSVTNPLPSLITAIETVLAHAAPTPEYEALAAELASLHQWLEESNVVPTRPRLTSFAAPPVDSPLRLHPAYWAAMNLCYSSDIASILPLHPHSPDFAVYNAARSLSAFVPASATAEEIFAARVAPEPYRPTRLRMTKPGRPVPQEEIDEAALDVDFDL